MRIGLNSLIGDGFGTGSFSFGEVPSGGGAIPPESYAYTLYTQEYPIEEGGEYFLFVEQGYNVPEETCDVEVWHDGIGGFYTKWSTATNVQKKEYGTVFYSEVQTQTPVELTAFGYFYDSEFRNADYIHEGTGGYTVIGDWAYYPLGTLVDTTGVIDSPYTTEIPASSGNFFNNGKYDTYQWDGEGAIIDLLNQGSYYSNGTGTTVTSDEMVEVPSGSAYYVNNGRHSEYLWNGSGGFYSSSPIGSYFPNGTYIYADGSYSYYWDGSGGYYTGDL